MNSRILELTRDSVKSLDEIYEFRAFSQLMYMIFDNSVSKGFKIRAVIPHTNQFADQDVIREKLTLYEQKYLIELSFQMSVSIFEAWLFDLLRILLSDPNRLNKKRKVDVSEVVSAKSFDDLKRFIIDSELNEIRYRKPGEWFEYLGNFVNIPSLAPNDIEKISEIKASRDILVHNNGIANQTYILKSAQHSRVQEGQPINISAEYMNESWTHLRQVVETVGNFIALKV